MSLDREAKFWRFSVRVESDRDRRVAEALLHDFRVSSRRK